MDQILEYRGVEGLVAAEVLTDDNEVGGGYAVGEVFDIAGVAEISRSTEASNEAHYYDNMPAIIVSNTAADTVTISTSAIPLDVYAKITGQNYDATTGAMIEGPRDFKYFALGYKTKKTNGDLVYVWRYKGTFNIPDQTNATENDGTDANGQELIYTGIQTTHKFTKTGKGAKAMNVDVAKDLANVDNFFDTVVTPDSLSAKLKLTITQGTGTTVTVTKNDTALVNGATLTAGDVLTISCTGGTLTVNGESFTSGNTHTVAGSVTVVSQA